MLRALVEVSEVETRADGIIPSGSGIRNSMHFLTGSKR
jgi:hypothetical protein